MEPKNRPVNIRVAAMILAAGSSSRMTGTHKLLRPWGNLTVVEHVAQTVAAAEFSDVALVLGCGLEKLAQAGRRTGLERVVCENAHLGMLASIQTGWELLIKRGPHGIMIILADQPLVTTAELQHLIETFKSSPQRILVPTWEGQRGNPVTIPARFGKELLEHPIVDKGASFLMARHPDEVRPLPMASANICADMDSEHDYQKLLTQYAKVSPHSGEGPES